MISLNSIPELIEKLKGELAVNPIDVLYDNRLMATDINCFPEYEEEHHKVLEKCDCVLGQIESSLPQEKKYLIEELEAANIRTGQLEMALAFQNGLLDGYRLAKFFSNMPKEESMKSTNKHTCKVRAI